MMDVGVSMTDTCTMVTSNPDALIAFVRMLAHQLSPDLFVSLMKSLNPAWAETAKTLSDACMGAPS